MDRYPKRLIEVDLPIKRISAHARREKSIRRGNISTLHTWWARRPLAACRAVICAALWLDPADELCPAAFREAAFQIMSNFAREAMTDRTVRDELLSEYTLGRVMAVNQENGGFGPDNPNANSVLRQILLDFIADFANWDASTNPLFLKTARALTQAAHKALGGEPGTRPLLVDPFAGGGSIPLEALRVGADVFASDLNPVAVLLNKVVLEYIPKYGQQLADEVRKWGEWIKKEAENELAEFYPKDSDGAIPIAYLWARTIKCEGPGCGAEVPLLRSLWLAKKSANSIALNLIPDLENKRINISIIERALSNDVSQGTIARGSATCPICGFTTPAASIRRQLKIARGGTANARLIAVRRDDPKSGIRGYRVANVIDFRAITKAEAEFDRQLSLHSGALSLIPDELVNPLPHSVNRLPMYGMATWGELFTPRQKLSLTVFSKLIRKVAGKTAVCESKELHHALNLCLSLALDRFADFNSSLCVLNSVGGRGVVHTFGRQALPMVWDFMETNPFNEVGANWDACIEAFTSTISNLDGIQNAGTGTVEKASATDHPLADNSAQLLVTDPPYYDMISYADLSDFFYVWLKRTLVSSNYSGYFLARTTPKADEIIVEPTPVEGVGVKDHSFYLSRMTKAMAESRRILTSDGVGIVVFAHKSTSGWEAQLQAMVDAGIVITASWPIDTEREARVSAIGQARLSSSIHLAFRPRENPDGSVRAVDIGDWRDIINELPRRIHEWMPRLAREGVVGADAIFACLGPALEIFSQYSTVEKVSGEKVELKEYLEHVWAAVAREALNMIFQGADASGFEEDARLTAMWLWTLRTSGENGHSAEAEEDDESEENGKPKPVTSGYSLEYDAARKIAQGLGAHLEALGHLVEIKGETATLLPAGARTRYLFGKEATQAPQRRRKKAERQLAFDFAHELEDVEEEAGLLPGNLSARPGATVLDQLHQSMILFGAGRGEALKRFLVDEGVGQNQLFWRLAQSLSALYPPASDEKRWVDGVLARKKGLGL
jgi:adenine-specific DNA methylase